MIDVLLQRKSLRRIAAKIIGIKRSSIRITTSFVATGNVSIGESKFGGCPDLPSITSWPRGVLNVPEPTPQFKQTYPNYAYLPPDGSFFLPFLAQINLSAIAEYDVEQLLPKDGMLYFFFNSSGYPSDTGLSSGIRDGIHSFEYNYYGLNSPERWRVIYIPKTELNLERKQTPSDIPQREVYGTQQLEFSQEWTIPPNPTCFVSDDEYQIPSRLRLQSHEARVYGNLHYYHRMSIPIHQMLGYGDDIQEFGMERSYLDVRATLFPELPPFDQLPMDAQLDELTQLRLLLQIGAQNNGMYFGRSGRLFFYMREIELRRRDFSKVWIETH